MDGYNKYKQMVDKYSGFTPEERVRWHLLNDCTCNVMDEWNNPSGHYGNCPLKNPDCERWIFFEGTDEGFIFPS